MARKLKQKGKAMHDELTRISLAEICDMLNVDAEWVIKVRRGRDATLMPAPLLGDEGLVWYEHDILSWLCYWSDRRQLVAEGSDPEALEAPTYFAVEPELREHRSKV